MWFYIYRLYSDSAQDSMVRVQEVGRTRFREDADKILGGWHSGYISHRGEIIVRKNVDEVEAAV